VGDDDDEGDEEAKEEEEEEEISSTSSTYTRTYPFPASLASFLLYCLFRARLCPFSQPLIPSDTPSAFAFSLARVFASLVLDNL
jgi:hypothetical protein